MGIICLVSTGGAPGVVDLVRCAVADDCVDPGTGTDSLRSQSFRPGTDRTSAGWILGDLEWLELTLRRGVQGIFWT